MPKQKTYYNPNLTNITDEFTREQVSLGVGSIACSNVPEYIPHFDKAPCETVIKGGHNSFVVLGRDRDQSWLSGRGGEGMTGCGMIDIVVGRGQLMAANDIKNKREPYNDIEQLGPSFGGDAARVYITQCSQDIDKYFAIETGGGPPSEGKSAIGIKADQVRMIGREKVAIYAGRGKFQGFGIDGETNCLGERLSDARIELIAGNKDNLEPMVLGNQLVNYLKAEHDVVRNIAKQLFQLNINLAALSVPLSALPGMAAVTVPLIKGSAEGAYDQIAQTLNTYLSELNALDGDIIPGQGYILSKTCFTSK